MTNIGWGAIITLAIFVVSNIAALIYWSARISTLLEVLQRELRDMTIELKSMKDVYLSKEAFSYRIAQSDKEHTAMWKKIDELAGKM